MTTTSKPRAAVFVDVQNIYYTCREVFQRQFNYRNLWHHLAADYDITRAIAYAIDRQHDGQQKFQQALRSIGFEVKLKPYIQRSDGTAKGDWDVGIALDVMEYAGEVDHLFLLSGDGDFAMLLSRVSAKHHVKTHVVSVEALTANALIADAHYYHPILDDPAAMASLL